MKSNDKKLSLARQEELTGILKARFEENMQRHKNIAWEDVQRRLSTKTEKTWSLYEMERTGGEPDVLEYDDETGQYVFYDCAAESPKGRRKLCYDRKALESRKKFKPEGSAMETAAEMGLELLTEEQYRKLQQFGDFDTKTSSWVQTPTAVRELGGALFGDRRFGRVFIYHNGAESYYGARGFRAALRL